MATAEVRADAVSPETAAPQAMGVIVKLKDGRVTTADGRGMARPSTLTPEVAQRRRMQIAQVAQRQRVSFLVQKDTVFGAQVLHRGEPVALKDAEAEAVRLRQDPDVEWAVPNEILKAATVTTGQTVPSVNYVGRFWIRSRVAEGAGVADFPAAWTFLAGRTLTPVVTAVLDSGVTLSKSNVDSTPHPDFDNRLFSGYDFVSNVTVANDGNGRDADVSDPGDAEAGCPGDPTVCSSWHGTSITSMLTAPRTSSGSGIEMGPGIFAPIDGQPVVLPIRVGGVGGASSSDIIDAMYWAAGLTTVNGVANANPARVISLSYGSSGNCQGGSATVDALYRNAIATLRSFGVVIVASAGNGDGFGTAGYATPSKPSSCQGVIASTGLRTDATKASYANLVNGTRAAQCYFGVAVASGDAGEAGKTLSMLGNTGTTVPLVTNVQSGIRGTSFAAPQVAGVAALMLAVNPALSSVDVAYRIMQSATTFPVSGAACSASNLGNCSCTSGTCGKGVLDAAAALNAAQNAPLFAEGACPSPDVETASPSKGGGGGSSDIGMLALLAALATWMLGAAAWQRRKARQAKPAFVTTGKR